jgi:hypothetical protein
MWIEAMNKIALLLGLLMSMQLHAAYPMAEKTATLPRYTPVIGTAEHPTVEGGIINSTEKNIPRAIKEVHTPIIQPAMTILPLTKKHYPQQEERSAAFSDSWTNSKRVSRLLMQAAQGKKLETVLRKTRVLGLPYSLALVPMVESQYQTNVVSKKGAAGAWQLMPSTAKGYGLSPKERFLFSASTDTALHLLKDLYTEFGNWELAFSAYNAGSTRVLRALKNNPLARTIEDLNLPLETKQYVQRLRAIGAVLHEMADTGDVTSFRNPIERMK